MDIFETVLHAMGVTGSVFDNFQRRDMLTDESGAVYVGMANDQRPEKFLILERGRRYVVDLKNRFPEIESVQDRDGRSVPGDEEARRSVLGLLRQMRAFHGPTERAS